MIIIIRNCTIRHKIAGEYSKSTTMSYIVGPHGVIVLVILKMQSSLSLSQYLMHQTSDHNVKCDY